MKTKPKAQNIDLIYKNEIENHHAYYEPMKYSEILEWEDEKIIHKPYMRWIRWWNCLEIILRQSS